jgi:flagellar hook-basal body complex protein FliE
MKTGMIDSSRIEAMLTQLRAAAARPQGIDGPIKTEAPSGSGQVNFADVLKTTLDQVNSSQQKSQQLGENFAMGDDKVSLSDVMISMQKSSIAFQATVQVRNKLVSAYHEIMNMQV